MMKRYGRWITLSGFFLLVSCAQVDTPAMNDPTEINSQLSSTPLVASSDIINTSDATQAVFNPITPSPMPTDMIIAPWVTPTFPLTPFNQTHEIEVHPRLTWLECDVSYDIFHDWRVAEHCFGFPLPSWQEGDSVRFGEIFERDANIWYDHRITIGADVYETDKRPNGPYILYKNGEIFTQANSGDTTYPPNRSLLEVEGKVVWELADPWNPTVIFDGRDLREEYNLEAAYIPYNIAGSLIFTAKQGSNYFIIFNGWQIGPMFDDISIGYCCGPARYSIRRVQDQYWFWGVRENRYYLIVISSND